MQTKIKHSVDQSLNLTGDDPAGLRKAGFNSVPLTGLGFCAKKSGFQCTFYRVEHSILVAVSSGMPGRNDLNLFNKKLIESSESDGTNDHFIWKITDADSFSSRISTYLADTFKIIGAHFSQTYLVGSLHTHILATQQFDLYDSLTPVPGLADSIQVAVKKIMNAKPNAERASGSTKARIWSRSKLEKLTKDELVKLILESEKKQNDRISELNQLVSNMEWDEDTEDLPGTHPDDDPYHELARALSQLRHKANKMVTELTDLNKNLEFRVAERIVELIEKESNLRAILDNSTDATCLTDFRHQLIDFNITFSKEIKKRFGVDPEVKDNFLDIFQSENDRSEWKDRLEKALDGKPGIYIDQYLRGEDMKVYEVKTFPINGTGAARGVTIFIKDITHIQRSELKYIEKNRELDRINKELDNFVYRVSHDLRAPITSIMGLINLIKLENDPAKLSTYIGLQERSVKKLDHFIKDIINLSRNTRLGVTVERINFHQLVQEIYTELDDGSGAVEKRLTVNEVVPLYSDRQRIHTILTNLISNSIKFYNNHQENPFVHVNLISDEDSVTIEVKDNGIGIPPEYLSKIYTMFFRAAKDNPGSGLGLYIVKETINKLKGHITARSKLREGTTFIIKIPNLIKRYEAAPKLL